MIFPTIPERVETPVLIMTSLMKAFTVLGLIFMRAAISLLVSPSNKNPTVSRSRVCSLTWLASHNLTQYVTQLYRGVPEHCQYCRVPECPVHTGLRGHNTDCICAFIQHHRRRIGVHGGGVVKPLD